MKSLMIGAAAFALYVIGAAVPLEWFWFNPGTPIFADTEAGGDPELFYDRQIKAVIGISYALILRDAKTHDVVCDANGGPFDYLPEKSGPLIGKTLSWFAPSDPRCRALPPGTYFGQVTWTAAYPLRAYLPGILQGPLGWIIPPKSVTRDIPPFKITVGEP